MFESHCTPFQSSLQVQELSIRLRSVVRNMEDPCLKCFWKRLPQKVEYSSITDLGSCHGAVIREEGRSREARIWLVTSAQKETVNAAG